MYCWLTLSLLILEMDSHRLFYRNSPEIDTLKGVHFNHLFSLMWLQWHTIPNRSEYEFYWPFSRYPFDSVIFGSYLLKLYYLEPDTLISGQLYEPFLSLLSEYICEINTYARWSRIWSDEAFCISFLLLPFPRFWTSCFEWFAFSLYLIAWQCKQRIVILFINMRRHKGLAL